MGRARKYFVINLDGNIYIAKKFDETDRYHLYTEDGYYRGDANIPDIETILVKN